MGFCKLAFPKIHCGGSMQAHARLPSVSLSGSCIARNIEAGAARLEEYNCTPQMTFLIIIHVDRINFNEF